MNPFTETLARERIAEMHRDARNDRKARELTPRRRLLSRRSTVLAPAD